MMAEREDAYWWHSVRRLMSFGLLRRFGAQRGCRWLDLGCGTSGNLGILEPLQPSLVVGLDISSIALDIARRKRPKALLVRADLNGTLPFGDETFDVVTVFNVLYHDWIKTDAAVFREIARVLRPGGVFLLTEPAFPILSREMDVAAMAQRRYRKREIAQLCRSGGFNVQFISYFTSFGFLLLLGWKLISKLKPGKRDMKGTAPDMNPIHPFTNTVLRALATLESNVIVVGVPMPFGTTVVCVARKPAT
jgi:SAM-dependent methyltransferase